MYKILGFSVVVLIGGGGLVCPRPADGTTTLRVEDSKALQRAQADQNAGRYDEAETTYLRIMTEYAASKEALESRVHLAVLHATSGRLPEAVTSFRQLATTFTTKEQTGEALRLIAYDSMRSPNYREAVEFCKSAIDVCPSSTRELWAQTALVLWEASSKDPNGFDSLPDLLRDYADDPQAAEALSLVGWNYRILNEPAKARSLYRHVVDTWPTAERALYAQRGLVRTCVAMGDLKSADEAVAGLLSKFRDDSRLANVVFQLGREYMDEGQRDRARTLFQYIVDNHPTSSDAMTAQVRAVQLNIERGQNQVAAAGLENLFSQWSSADKLPQVLVWIAESYGRTGQWRNAALVCDQVVRQHADDPYAKLAKALGWACSDGVLTDDPNATNVAGSLWKAYPDDPMVPKAVYIAAEMLRDRAAVYTRQGRQDLHRCICQQAVRVCESLLKESPQSTYAPAATIIIGDCLGQMGQESQAIASYFKFIEQWPQHELASTALLKVGLTYEASSVPLNYARERTVRSCYTRLLREYPNCQAATYAENWLKQYSN